MLSPIGGLSPIPGGNSIRRPAPQFPRCALDLPKPGPAAGAPSSEPKRSLGWKRLEVWMMIWDYPQVFTV